MAARSSSPGDNFPKCNSGFVPDEQNGLCYFVSGDPADFSDATELRCPDLEAELVRFDSDEQARGLWALLNNGTKFLSAWLFYPFQL